VLRTNFNDKTTTNALETLSAMYCPPSAATFTATLASISFASESVPTTYQDHTRVVSSEGEAEFEGRYELRIGAETRGEQEILGCF
jgi:hypothetical protein